MAKYVINYTETYSKTFIVEADTPEEAEEKMEYAAEYLPLGMGSHFHHWDIGAARVATKKEQERFDPLPEE